MSPTPFQSDILRRSNVRKDTLSETLFQRTNYQSTLLGPNTCINFSILLELI